MFHQKNLKSLVAQITFLTVIVVAGLWMGAWIMSIPSSHASDTLPAPLIFQSPIGNPILNVEKTVDNDNPGPGDEIVYTLTYSSTNPGSQAFNARLYDFLPAGVQLVSSDPSVPLVDGALLFTAPSIGPTEVTATVRVRVLEGYEQLYNHTLVAADGIDTNHASLLTSVEPPTPWLDLSKTGPSAVLTNTELVYTIRCENPSGFGVSGVTVIDVLPAGVTFNSASPTPDVVALPLLSWSLGDLGPGASQEIVITVTSPSSVGTLTNTAIADAQQRIMTQTLFTTEVITEGAILQLSKGGSATDVYLADELVYTLRYENSGNQTANGVVLTDTLPADVTVTGVSIPTTSSTAEQLVWNIGPVTETLSGEIAITVTVQGDERSMLNVADITAPNSFPGHAEYSVNVHRRKMYLPIVTRQL